MPSENPANPVAETAWLESDAERGTAENGQAALTVRSVGPDLHVVAEVSRRVFVATSLPAWPGWRAESGGRPLPVTTVNHAFVGFWVPPGTWPIRLSYRPGSFPLGLLAMAAGLAASIALARVRPRGKLGENPPQ